MWGETERSNEKTRNVGFRRLLLQWATFVTSDRFVDEKGMRRLEIITRAKSNTVAYTTAPTVNERRGRGRPRKYGDKVEMQSLFDLEADKFVEANIVLYGKKERVRILLRDLFWKPCQRTIRFVLVDGGKPSHPHVIRSCFRFGRHHQTVWTQVQN